MLTKFIFAELNDGDARKSRFWGLDKKRLLRASGLRPNFAISVRPGRRMGCFISPPVRRESSRDCFSAKYHFAGRSASSMSIRCGLCFKTFRLQFHGAAVLLYEFREDKFQEARARTAASGINSIPRPRRCGIDCA